MITDAELIFWIVAGIVGCVTFGILYAKGKRESEKYTSWIEWDQR